MCRLPHYRGIPYFTSLCSQAKPKTFYLQLISFRFEHAARIACSVNAALVLIRNTEMISVFKAK